MKPTRRDSGRRETISANLQNENVLDPALAVCAGEIVLRDLVVFVQAENGALQVVGCNSYGP